MNIRIIIPGTILVVSLLVGTILMPASSDAQPLPTAGSSSMSSSGSSLSPTLDTCRSDIEYHLSYMHGQYRYVLFGQHPASQEHVNALRIDRNGKLWLKGGDNVWGEAGGLVADDGEIDAMSRFPNRAGLLEAKGKLTSELIPDMVQSYRGFTCAVEAVCNAVTLNQSQITARTRPDGLMAIETPGCNAILLPADSMQSCTSLQGKDVAIKTWAESFCQPAARAVLQREAELLKMTVSYDAAYRSLLQFMGSFDGFTGRFEDDLLKPLEQTVSIAGQLSRIPCFLAQCNE